MLISLAIGAGWAAESGPASKASPAPVVAPETPDDQFALRLSPLTREDLAAEAKAWLGLLKAKTQEVVEARLVLRKASGAEAERLTEALLPLSAQRRALSARLSDILDEWEVKGGDPKEIEPYRQYVKAVYAEQIKAARLTTMWAPFASWVFSEEGGLAVAVKLLVLVLVFLLLLSVAKIVSALTGRALGRVPNVSILLKNSVTRVAFWVTIAAGQLVVLSAFGVNIGGVLALVGGASFIIAFAMQSTLTNFAAGLMIMIYKPFDVGNFVTVGGASGTVKEPAPVVRLQKLGDSSVNFVCRPWCKTVDYWTVFWDVTRQVKERFDAEGVSIPFPQRDVHLYTVESGEPA